MCRMAAFAAETPLTLGKLLGEALDDFKDLGRDNADGWGIAYRRGTETVPSVLQSTDPVHRSREFDTFCREVTLKSCLVHLRDATPGLDVSLGNTHPFVAGGYAFAHNGSISVDGLTTLLSDETRSVLRGETDSERYFALIRQFLATGMPALSAIVSAIRLIQDAEIFYSSLDAILLGPKDLTAACFFDPAASFERRTPGHFTLHLDIRHDVLGVVSSGWNGAPPISLMNGTIATVDLATRAVTAHETLLPTSGKKHDPRMP
jgi:hypothetical protein